MVRDIPGISNSSPTFTCQQCSKPLSHCLILVGWWWGLIYSIKYLFLHCNQKIVSNKSLMHLCRHIIRSLQDPAALLHRMPFWFSSGRRGLCFSVSILLHHRSTNRASSMNVTGKNSEARHSTYEIYEAPGLSASVITSAQNSPAASSQTSRNFDSLKSCKINQMALANANFGIKTTFSDKVF